MSTLARKPAVRPRAQAQHEHPKVEHVAGAGAPRERDHPRRATREDRPRGRLRRLLGQARRHLLPRGRHGDACLRRIHHDRLLGSLPHQRAGSQRTVSGTPSSAGRLTTTHIPPAVTTSKSCSNTLLLRRRPRVRRRVDAKKLKAPGQFIGRGPLSRARPGRPRLPAYCFVVQRLGRSLRSRRTALRVRACLTRLPSTAAGGMLRRLGSGARLLRRSDSRGGVWRELGPARACGMAPQTDGGYC